MEVKHANGFRRRPLLADHRVLLKNCLRISRRRGMKTAEKRPVQVLRRRRAPFRFRKRHRWAEIDVQLKVNVTHRNPASPSSQMKFSKPGANDPQHPKM